MKKAAAFTGFLMIYDVFLLNCEGYTTRTTTRRMEMKMEGEIAQWKVDKVIQIPMKKEERFKEFLEMVNIERLSLFDTNITQVEKGKFEFQSDPIPFFGDDIVVKVVFTGGITKNCSSVEIASNEIVLMGSEEAKKGNGAFNVSYALNIYEKTFIGQKRILQGRRRSLEATGKLNVFLQVPPDAKFPKRVIESTGNFVLGTVLGIAIKSAAKNTLNDCRMYMEEKERELSSAGNMT